MTGMRAGMMAVGLAIAIAALAACNGNDETETSTATVTAPATPEPTSAVDPTATPTPSLEELADEVSDAYLAYWDAYAEAVLNLDISYVEGFATGEELESIEEEIEALRAQGVALRVVVEHDFIVADVRGTEATVIDEIVNNSFTVDPETKEPPEGEGANNVFRDTVRLELLDGRWVVVSGTRDREE